MEPIVNEFERMIWLSQSRPIAWKPCSPPALGYLPDKTIVKNYILALKWIPRKVTANWKLSRTGETNSCLRVLQHPASFVLWRAFVLLSILCFSPYHMYFHRQWAASLRVETVAAPLSMNDQHQHVPCTKLAWWLPGLSDKRNFCRTPLPVGFLCFMRSAQGTGRIRGSDNRTSCCKMDSDNLPKNIQIFCLLALCVILNLNLITAISSGWLPMHYYPVYHPLFDIYLFKMKMTFGPGR